MKPIYPTLILLFVFTGVFSQAPLVKQWDMRYGGDSVDELSFVTPTNDGGSLLGGKSFSGISGDRTQSARGNTDYWIVKLNSSGVKQWDKRFGGQQTDSPSEAQQTSDGGYIVGGVCYSYMDGVDITEENKGIADYWIVKTDGAGNKLWDKRYGGFFTDILLSLKQTADGGYILGGYSYSDSGADKTQHTRGAIDYWVVKTDQTGNKLWDKTFGGTGDDYLFDVKQTFDGGYILGGWITSDAGGDITEATRGNWDYWIVKINSAGNKQWDKRIGGSGSDRLASVIQTADGGYYLAGTSSSLASGDKTQAPWGGHDFWAVKIDSSGGKCWDRVYGGTSSEFELGNAIQTKDGGFLLAGTSHSPISGDKTEANLGTEQTWVIKTDACGIKQWDKTILTTGTDEIGYVAQTLDKCYIFANYTKAGTGGYKTQLSRGLEDYWAVKFCDTSTFAVSSCTCPSVCEGTGYFAGGAWQNVSGVYRDTLTTLGGYDSIVTVSLTVHDTFALVTVSNNTLTASPGIAYQWFLNGSPITGATDSIYIATQGGSYTVQVTDSNGCTATSSPVVFTGIDNFTEGDVVSVYPNPNDFGFWILECGSNYLGGSLEIFDANGRMVLSSKLKEQSSKIEFNGTRGIYLLRISSSKSSVVRKLVRM